MCAIADAEHNRHMHSDEAMRFFIPASTQNVPNEIMRPFGTLYPVIS